MNTLPAFDAASLHGVTTHPVFVAVAVAVTALAFIGQAFPKITGPFQQGIENWSLSRRRAQDAAKASVMADLEAELDRYQEMVRDLRGELADHRTETTRHGDVLVVHARWDQRAITEALRHGVDLGAAPPLYPVCPHTGAPVIGPASDGGPPDQTRNPL